MKPNMQVKALAAAIALIPLSGLSASAMAAKIEEVVVTASPIRDSQQAAIDAKREARNLIDVISADTIGRFPDQNLADSLGRVPGMAIERDQGQARYINFRGMPFRYTAIGFDGIEVPGAENGRIPRFDSFPSVITSKVEVNKAVLPSMTGEAIAGYIDIQTFNPFDREGFSLDADLGMGEQDLGGGDIEKYSLRSSWSNEKFGVVVFGSQNSREQITDNREYDLERAENGDLVVNQLQFRSYKVKRDDEAYGGRLEYRGEDIVERAFVTTLYSEFVDIEERNHYQFTFVAPQAGNTATDAPLFIDRLLEFGEYDNSTQTSTLGLDLKLADWSLDARYNVTSTEFNTRLPILYSSGVNVITRAPSLTSGSYDVSDIEDPRLTLAAPLADYDYAALYAYKIDWPLEVDADKFKLDGERELTVAGHDSILRLGLQYDKREADGYSATHFDVFEFDQDRNFATVDSIGIDNFDTGEPWDSNTTNTIGGTYFDNKGLRNAWKAVGGNLYPEPTEDQLIAIEEEITSSYAMATTNFNWGNLVYGLRVEKTDYTSKGTLEGEAVSVSNSFTNVMPGLHANIDLADDLKWRTSATTGVSRPTYIEWRATAAVNPTDQAIEGGNPNLDPEETWGLDTAVEWYFAPASLLSAGAFYRSIDNVIYTDVSTVDAGRYLPAFAGQQWSYEGAVNGNDGEIQGAEVNFIAQAEDVLPSPFDGFGLSGNVTFLNSEFSGLDGTKYDLPGTSDLLYNASLFYEKYDLSVRLNYQYRDEWISPIEDPTEYWGEQERVDMSVQYKLPLDLNGANMTIYANANNLTDETDVRYAGNGTINQAESYGRAYLLGIRLSY